MMGVMMMYGVIWNLVLSFKCERSSMISCCLLSLYNRVENLTNESVFAPLTVDLSDQLVTCEVRQVMVTKMRMSHHFTG